MTFNLNKFKSRGFELDPNSPKIEHTVENGRTYVIRNGRRIEVKTLSPDSAPPKTKRKAFKPKFAQLPMLWVEALEREPNGYTYQLAIRIQLEVFQRKRMGGEIVLSAEMAGISRLARYRAAKELERLGLIKLHREGNHALRITIPEE